MGEHKRVLFLSKLDRPRSHSQQVILAISSKFHYELSLGLHNTSILRRWFSLVSTLMTTHALIVQAIELSREQRQIHLNISSPRVKVRETEVVMSM